MFFDPQLFDQPWKVNPVFFPGMPDHIRVGFAEDNVNELRVFLHAHPAKPAVLLQFPYFFR